MKAARGAALLCLLPWIALAHESGPLHPDDLWSAWPLEPGVILPLLTAAILYMRGARVARGAMRMQQVCFWCGMAALGVALATPLHPMGEVLFSAHMMQH